MKRIIIAITALVAAVSLVNSEEQSSADFFRKDQELYAKQGKPLTASPAKLFSATVSNAPTGVAQMVAKSAERVLGPEWVQSALHIARIESTFTCNALGPRVKGGRASGVFQVMPGSAKALGYDYTKLHNCQYGIDAGLKHMQQCIVQGGVKTPVQMRACHVAGWAGWNKRLKPKAQRYRAKYVRL